MTLSRRHLLRSAALFPLARLSLGPAFGEGAAPTSPGEVPPIVFVHGNGDHAGLWTAVIWRFESNGVARDWLHAFNFLDPLARSNDSQPQANRSSTDDQLRELTAAVEAVRRRTGAAKVALVGSSRGGYA